MNFEQNGIYFDGPSGVYYQPILDELFVLDKSELKMTYNADTSNVQTYPTFKVWSSKLDGRLLILYGDALEYIGDL